MTSKVARVRRSGTGRRARRFVPSGMGAVLEERTLLTSSVFFAGASGNYVAGQKVLIAVGNTGDDDGPAITQVQFSSSTDLITGQSPWRADMSQGTSLGDSYTANGFWWPDTGAAAEWNVWVPSPSGSQTETVTITAQVFFQGGGQDTLKAMWNVSVPTVKDFTVQTLGPSTWVNTATLARWSNDQFPVQFALTVPHDQFWAPGTYSMVQMARISYMELDSHIGSTFYDWYSQFPAHYYSLDEDPFDSPSPNQWTFDTTVFNANSIETPWIEFDDPFAYISPRTGETVDRIIMSVTFEDFICFRPVGGVYTIIGEAYWNINNNYSNGAVQSTTAAFQAVGSPNTGYMTWTGNFIPDAFYYSNIGLYAEDGFGASNPPSHVTAAYSPPAQANPVVVATTTQALTPNPFASGLVAMPAALPSVSVLYNPEKPGLLLS